MIGPCFLTLEAEGKIRLSELKVTGYEESMEYLMEMGFSVTFQRRASNGMPYATYEWADSSEDMETWVGGSWYNQDTSAIITSENDVLFNPGDGLWFDTPELKDCSGFNLVSSGQVISGSQGFELNAGGKIGVCNMMPAAVNLSTIEIQGYEDSMEYLMEMGFSVTMQSLLSNGMPSVTYEWSDASEDMETWVGGAWYNQDTTELITKENDVVIAPGQGFWADAPELKDCTAFHFVVPAVIGE